LKEDKKKGNPGHVTTILKRKDKTRKSLTQPMKELLTAMVLPCMHAQGVPQCIE
jgi:hypothetical protein